jgi:pimeloyl-ACP methyl ester carboxylesterase
MKRDIPLTEIVRRRPNFAYQLWFASPDSERELSSPQAIEKFLKAMFRIKGDPPVLWNTGKDMMQAIGDPSLGKVWENQRVWEYYLRSFTRTGSLRGPLNYYKTRDLNFRDELELVANGKVKVSCPAMFIGAMEDRALPPSVWKGQEWVPQLEQYTVSQGHWCLVENGGKEIQPIIQKWVTKVSKSAKL